MKKLVFVLVLFPVMVSMTFGQNSSPMDLILLLDTSSSMSGSYRELNDYLTGSFLREFLRIGDTFHLIPFSDKSAVDISRRVEGRGDVETIIGRMLLQYPVEPWSDIPAALGFAENYAGTLPGSRPKKIVLVTDGDVSPAPGSASFGSGAAGFEGLVSDARARLSQKGIGLEYVKVPIAAAPSSVRPSRPPSETPKPAERPAAAGPAAVERPPAAAGPAAAETPPLPPAGSSAASAPPQSESTDTGAAAPETPAVPAQRPAEIVSPPAPEEPPRREIPDPGAGQDRETAVELFAGDIPLPLIIGLAILALLLLGLIIFFAARRLQGTPNRAMASAAAPRPREEPLQPRQPQGHNTDLLNSYAANQKPRSGPYENKYRPQETNYEGPLLLNLFVEDQNTAIGKRNIHAVKSGYNFTVGGGRSDFLIFLVPVPPHIGEIRCEGRNCTFIPRRPEYFPDIGSQQVPECIGKTIRVISDKKYEIRFRIERYEDPLKALNRLLHSVQVPG